MRIWWAAMAAAAMLAAPVAALALQTKPGLIPASEQLRAKLAAAARGAAPRLTNADAALVRAAFDPAAVRAMPLDVAIGDACVAIGSTIVAYAEYATRVTVAEPDARRASDAVLLDLQDEMALGATAANVCVQRGFRSVVPVVAVFPVERRGNVTGPLKQMRDGAEQTIRGTLASAAEPKLKPANRRMMLSAVLEDAPELAASFPAGERKRVRETVLGFIAAATPESRTQIKAIAAAFAGTRCNLLCTVAGGK